MTQICVQFSDVSKSTIIAAFSSAQDATSFPNQGTVADSDPKWATYYASIPAGARGGWAPPVTG